MNKGIIMHQGIVIGEVERVECGTDTQYTFTYDPSFDECFQLVDMDVRDEPYYMDNLPSIIDLQLNAINSTALQLVRRNTFFRDDFDLWLACCDAGLIKEDEGCRVV